MPTYTSGADTYHFTERELHFGYSFLPGLLFVGLMWLVGVLSFLTEADLGFLGILPRNFYGLVGVFFGPLIHGDLLHLLSNTFPLLLLSGFILYMHRKVALKVMVLVYLLSGLLTWLIGRQSYHIGASGVIYGLAGFLLFHGFLRQNRGAMAVSFAILFLYSGLFYGLFPGDEGVSWEGHLSGLVSGLVAAIAFGEGNPQPKDKPLATSLVQRHMSNTMGPYYQHLHIHYQIQPQRKPHSYTYSYVPPAVAASIQTKAGGISSNEKEKTKIAPWTKGNER